MKKTKNAGFSLVELIIVVAILGILVGSGVSMMGLIAGKDAKQAQANVSSVLGKARIETMSKKSLKLEIYRETADGAYFWRYIVDGVTDATAEKIASKKVEISYTDTNGTTHNIMPGASLILQFDRSSGALKPFSSGSYCNGIIFKQGTTERKIEIYPATGRHN